MRQSEKSFKYNQFEIFCYILIEVNYNFELFIKPYKISVSSSFGLGHDQSWLIKKFKRGHRGQIVDHGSISV